VAAMRTLEVSASFEVSDMDESFNRIINAANSFLGKVRHYGEGVAATPAEAHLVTAIHNHPEANTIRLARIMGFTKGNISLRTAKLCEKGLIEKYNKNHNKKEIFYRLTAKGRALFDAHARFHAEQNRRIYQKYLSFSQEEKGFLCGFLREYAAYLEDYYFRENNRSEPGAKGKGGDSHG
jgi:DNA-binding MarR family transcriptional regulator